MVGRDEQLDETKHGILFQTTMHSCKAASPHPIPVCHRVSLTRVAVRVFNSINSVSNR